MARPRSDPTLDKYVGQLFLSVLFGSNFDLELCTCLPFTGVIFIYPRWRILPARLICRTPGRSSALASSRTLCLENSCLIYKDDDDGDQHRHNEEGDWESSL